MAKSDRPGTKRDEPYYDYFVDKFIECNHRIRSVRFAREAAGRPPSKSVKSESNEARRLLRIPYVKETLDQRRKDYLKEMGVSPEKTLAEVAKLAFARLPDLFIINNEGEAVFNLNLMTPEIEAAIGEYTVDTYMQGRGKDAVEIKKVRVKLANKLDALEKLMRYFGMYEKDNDQTTASLIDGIRAGRERARDKREEK